MAIETNETATIQESNYPVYMEKLSDWFNPILVKEVRRSIKSREFVITFLLLVFISWVISIFGMLTKGSQIEFGSPSRDFFICYYSCMCFAIMVIVPFSAYRSMMAEQEHQTLEILNITTLSPRKIVWGKFLTSVVQMFLYYCVVAPFVSFTSLLQGYDLASFSYMLFIAGFISVMITIASLMLTTNIKGRMWKNLMVGGMLLGLLFLYFVISSLLWSIFYDGVIEFNEKFYILNTCLILYGMAIFFLCEQISISALTFESDDRSSGIRIATILIYLLGVAIVLTATSYSLTSISPNDYFYFSNIGIFIWMKLGYYSVGHSDFLSRRIRISLTKTPYLIRVFKCFLLPGGSRAYVLVLLGLMINMTLCNFLINDINKLNGSRIATAYVAAFLGFHCFKMRQLNSFSSETKPLHGLVIMLLILALGIVFPLTITWVQQEFYRNYEYRFSHWHATNPFYTIYYVSEGNVEATDVTFYIMLIAIAMILLNLKSMIKACSDVIRPRLDGPPIERQASTSDVRGIVVD